MGEAAEFELDVAGPMGPHLAEALCQVAAKHGRQVVAVRLVKTTIVVRLDGNLSQAEIVQVLTDLTHLDSRAMRFS